MAKTLSTTLEIILSRVTYDGLELQEESAALHGPDRAAGRALEAVLKVFSAVQ
jgi:hypothetical protein